jgi:hypothetical protein
MKQSMGIGTPQDDSGTLSLENGSYLFGYAPRCSAPCIQLNQLVK